MHASTDTRLTRLDGFRTLPSMANACKFESILKRTTRNSEIFKTNTLHLRKESYYVTCMVPVKTPDVNDSKPWHEWPCMQN